MFGWLRREKPLEINNFSHPLPWMQHLGEPEDRADYRGTPTYVCPCGSDMFLIAARFDDTQLPAWYLLDGVCAHCGALVSVPCPADGPDPLEVNDDMSFM
jgi:hypothetical protein